MIICCTWNAILKVPRTKSSTWCFDFRNDYILRSFWKETSKLIQDLQRLVQKCSHIWCGNPKFTFIPPSHKNFIYDLFLINFERPFEKVYYEELVGNKVRKSKKLDENFAFGTSNDVLKDDSFNFENFMKCIKDLLYSFMFSDSNSKKFHFNSCFIRSLIVWGAIATRVSGQQKDISWGCSQEKYFAMA